MDKQTIVYTVHLYDQHFFVINYWVEFIIA